MFTEEQAKKLAHICQDHRIRSIVTDMSDNEVCAYNLANTGATCIFSSDWKVLNENSYDDFVYALQQKNVKHIIFRVTDGGPNPLMLKQNAMNKIIVVWNNQGVLHRFQKAVLEDFINTHFSQDIVVESYTTVIENRMAARV